MLSSGFRPLKQLASHCSLLTTLALFPAILTAARVSQQIAEQVAVNFGNSVFDATCHAIEVWPYYDLNDSLAVYSVGLQLSGSPHSYRTLLVSADDEDFPILENRSGLPLNRRMAEPALAVAQQTLGAGSVHYVRGIYYTPMDLWFEYGDGQRQVYVSPFNLEALSHSKVFCIPPLAPDPKMRPAARAQWGRWRHPSGQLDVAKRWITGVPDYDWHFGCVSSAITNVLAYWDRRGYSRLVDSVWYNRYDPLERDYDSVPNCNLELALALGTDTTRGSTRIDSIVPGILKVCNSPAYGNNYAFQSRSSKNDLALLVHEINAGRPGVLGLLRHHRYGNHAVTFVGWGPPNDSWVCIHDEWSTGTPPDTVIRFFYASGFTLTIPIQPGGFSGPDVGIDTILAPALVVFPESLAPRIAVHNYGPDTQNFTCYFQIGSGYRDSQPVSNLTGGEIRELVFDKWRPPGLEFYSVKCSIALSNDSAPFNNVRRRMILVDTVLPVSWTQLADVPAGPKGKNVWKGACLTSDDTFVYAFKGSGTNEFCRFSPGSNSWSSQETIPRRGTTGKRLGIKSGAALCYGDNGALYAVKGNNSLEFWSYNPSYSSHPSYPWTQLADVPAGMKRIRQGAGLAAFRRADTSYVYLLKASRTSEFYCYNTATGLWETLPPAPVPRRRTSYRDGSCIVSDGEGKIYAFLSHSTDFAAFDVARQQWTTRRSIPLVGFAQRKRLVKPGAALARNSAGIIYCLKGGNSPEFWAYNPGADSWIQKEDIPLGPRAGIRAGGALACLGKHVYCLRGDKTAQFFMTVPEPDFPTDGAGQMATTAPPVTTATDCSPLPVPGSPKVAPNPLRRCALVGFSITRPGVAALRLYDCAGRLVRSWRQRTDRSGPCTSLLEAQGLSPGVYLLKLATPDGETQTKVVVAQTWNRR
jgi:hypothetical protein